MTLLEERRASEDAGPAPLPIPVPARNLVGPAVAAGLLVTALAAALIVLEPANGPLLAIGLVVGAPVLAGGAYLLARRPEFAAWAAVVLFSTSAELRLRVHPAIGVLKDVFVAVVVVLAVIWLRNQPGTLRRLR